MRNPTPKLSSAGPNGPSEPHAASGHYQRLAGPWGDAVALHAPAKPIRLMLKLTRCVPGPFAVLYLLPECHGAHPHGRYQSPFPLGRRKVVEFCERFERFLERDRRHAVWVMTEDCAERVIYDRRQMLFAYGPLEEFERTLAAEGYGPARIEIPRRLDPRVDADLDPELERLLDWWPWIRCPLWPGDEL
ncbi:MAG: hypothetical protein ACYTF8_09575 [Planctomycetota bacterium]|jgi:hypothetical protein